MVSLSLLILSVNSDSQLIAPKSSSFTILLNMKWKCYRRKSWHIWNRFMPNVIPMVKLKQENVTARSPCIIMVSPPSQLYKEIILTRLSTIQIRAGCRMNMAFRLHKEALSMHRQGFSLRKDRIRNKLYCKDAA